MINYKSELINKILGERGHEMSTLHYESECIETWINEVKGSYPKLTDYESEWLNYIIENPIGEFPYETITDVTDATVNNVVPYAYKSAILKGDSQRVFSPTKNLFDKTNVTFDIVVDIHTGDRITESGTNTTGFIKVNPNTQYTMSFNFETNAWTRCFGLTEPKHGMYVTDAKGVSSKCYFDSGLKKYTFTTSPTTNYLIFSFGSGVEETFQLEKGATATDYEEPNYELQSVKMPVLTTTNTNNLIDTNPNSWHVIDGKTQIIQNKPIKVQPNTKYSFFINTGRWAYIFKCDEFGKTSKQYIGNNKGGGTFITDDDCYYVIARNDLFADVTKAHTDKMRLFLGSEDLGYTGYVDEVNSNILTTPEDVTLRGIGEVKDELNLLTGEVSNNFNKITIDGTENWYKSSNETDITIRYRCDNIGVSILKENICICDNYNVGGNTSGNDLVVAFGGTTITYRVLKSKFPTLEDFKKWLNDNPHTFIYQTEKSIKTVNLSVIDQNGTTLSKIKPIEGTMHISTDGTPLKPTVTMEIPVEAITQNLNSFIEE